MVIPFHLVIAYSLGTIFLPANHYLGLGVSGNYFDSLIASEWSETDVALNWRYGPVLSYTNSIYMSENIFFTSSLSYSTYISISRRNDDGEGYIWLDDRDNYIKSDFQFFDAGFGIGVNLKMNKIILPFAVTYSFHNLYYGTFYSYGFFDDGTKFFSYNEYNDYKYRGGGRSVGIEVKMLTDKKNTPKLVPYVKYNFIDTTHIDEYNDETIYAHEYFLDERCEFGVLYDFREFKITF